MKFLAIVLGKIAYLLGKMIGRGSDMPGRVALKIDKNILKKIKFPEIRIIVTGSSGKGSTTAVIANVLKKNGVRVCYNSSGANMASGIISTILGECSLGGKINADAVLFEMDERNTKFVYQSMKPTHVLITNLTKDQPPRQHDVDFILSEILKNINDEAVLITNMDDPFMRNIEKKVPNKVEYYSIASNKYSYKDQLFENLIINHCPDCGALLKYDYYNIETLGKYSCPNCDFKYIKPKFYGEDMDLENGTLNINGSMVKIGGDMIYYAYNTMAAYSMLSTLNLGIDVAGSINSINDYKPNYFEAYGRKFYNLSCKAENASTYNQVVYKSYCVPGLKDYVIGWLEISRRYVHFDLSWLYDVEFELFNDSNLNKIYCCGIDADNIKKRLLIAGIDEAKIVTAIDIPSIKSDVLADKVDAVCGVLNFDYCAPFDETFRGGEA